MKVLRLAVGKFLPFLELIVLWQVAALLLKSSAFPGPLEVLPQFRFRFGELLLHAEASIRRVLTAIVISVTVALPLGLFIGGSKFLHARLLPIIYAIYPVPKVAFLPVIMLLLGLGDFAKIFLMFLIIFLQVLVAVVDARRGLDRHLIESIMTLGPTRLQLVWHVLLPAVLPQLITAVRTSIGTAMSVLFFAETFGTEYGLGYFITDAWMRMDYLAMFSGIVTQSVLGLVLFRIVSWLEFHTRPWQTMKD